MKTTTSRLPLPVLLTLLTFGLANPARAADAPPIHTGNFELGGFGGVSLRSGSVKSSFGGNLAYALNRYVMPYGEVSYFPRNERFVRVSGIPGATSSFNVAAIDYSAGVHLRIPLPNTRFIPYAILGAGGFRYSGTTEQIQFPDAFNPGRFISIPFNTITETALAISYGGGVRVYANEVFGFRIEAKGYSPINSSLTESYFRVTGGVFFQFR